MNRRTFIKQATAVAGGILTGVSLPITEASEMIGVDFAKDQDITILGYSKQLDSIIWTVPNFEQLSYDQKRTVDLWIKAIALASGVDREILQGKQGTLKEWEKSVKMISISSQKGEVEWIAKSL